MAMKVNRRALARHLDKLSCNGLIEGAVLIGAFQARALSPDHLLFVDAPALESVEPLEGEIGVPWLDKLTGALRLISGGGEGEGSEAVEIRVEGQHLILDEGQRGELGLLIAQAKTIATYLPEEHLTALRVMVESKSFSAVKLTPRLLADMQSAFSFFKADEIELTVAPRGGTIRVGNENSNVANFAVAELVAEEPYSLLFGRHLVDVLSVVDPATATLQLSGPDSVILIEDGEYRYVLSPRSRGADS